MGKLIPVDNGKPPLLENGVFYDLNPPSNIQGKIFPRVMCEYRVPAHPDEYVVKGIPQGGKEPESFVLKFTNRGKVLPQRSKDQQWP